MNISVLERLLNEGQAVDAEVKSIIKTILPEDMRDTAVGYINKLPWVKRSQNGKDAIPTAKWLVSMAGNVSWDRAVRQLGRLIQLKDRLNTTKRMDLAKLYDQYPTYDQLKEFLDDEKEKLANGWKDDFGTDVDVVDDDPDEVRMQRIRQDLGKPTFSTPGVVDIYRADTQDEAIRLGRGYSWCISYTTGDNYFYHYRTNDNSTAYFCFFKEPQPEYDDVACVIHVLKNGRYRMTNADNDNNSPIVDEERVVYCYPPLEDWLPDMTVTPVSDREQFFANIRKELGKDWLNLTRSMVSRYKFTRKDIRMLLNMGAGLSDSYFDYILDKYDHGKINDKDSLINLYAKVSVYPLTKHQKEVIGQNKSLKRFYDDRHDGKLEALADQEIERLDNRHILSLVDQVTVDGVTKDVYNIDSSDSDYIYYAQGTKSIVKWVSDLEVSPICQTLVGVPGCFDISVSDNKYIESLDGVEARHITSVSNCSALLGVGDAKIGGNMYISHCPKFNSFVGMRVGAWKEERRVELTALPALKSLNGLQAYSDLYSLALLYLKGITKLDYLPQKVSQVEINDCPNLVDLGDLLNVIGNNSITIIDSPNIRFDADKVKPRDIGARSYPSIRFRGESSRDAIEEAVLKLLPKGFGVDAGEWRFPDGGVYFIPSDSDWSERAIDFLSKGGHFTRR